jgi:uncharacterized protein with GYD domain
MPLYVLLTRVTPEGIKTIRDNPRRIKEVNREIESRGAKVLAQYATLGRYDFVNIIEARDNGTVQIETLAAIPIDDFVRNLTTKKRAK